MWAIRSVAQAVVEPKYLKDRKAVRWVRIFPAFFPKWITFFLDNRIFNFFINNFLYEKEDGVALSNIIIARKMANL